MASSFFALFDDIATLLDDIAAITKVATRKTAGVLGDDLALNAQQVSGVAAERELPVVWAVAKGSARNKLILIPAALAIAALERWLHGQGFDIPLIMPLLMIGGAFLVFEGAEKLIHKLFHDKDEAHHEERLAALADEQVDMLKWESDKVKGAIRTDFILSAEIIVIALGTVADREFATQLGVLAAISALMTVGVYGLVAGIVKLDDIGYHMVREGAGSASRAIGRGILAFAPKLMRFLSVAGTAAMFLVGGAILVHGLPPLHHLFEAVQVLPPAWLWENLFNAAVGIVVGSIIVAVVTGIGKLRGKRTAAT